MRSTNCGPINISATETITTSARIGTEGQRERRLFPPATGLGDLVGDVEGLGEGACYRRDRPQREGHPEEEQLASRLLLGLLDHPY